MPTYQTPGVYIEEIATLPPSVAEVATAIPAFIGLTRARPTTEAGAIVVRLTSLLEYETAFGGPPATGFLVDATTDTNDNPTNQPTIKPLGTPAPSFSLYYALSLYFRNGGGPCYVVSVGTYETPVAGLAGLVTKGIDALERESEPTLIVLTDAAALLPAADYYTVAVQALAQCAKLRDRFAILDVPRGDIAGFRTGVGADNLMYGAAYHPYLQTSIPVVYDESSITLNVRGAGARPVTPTTGSLSLPDEDGIEVSYSGPVPAPRVTVTIVTTAPSFTIANGLLTIGALDTSKGSDIHDAWGAWKKIPANDSGGFDIDVAGTGETVMVGAAATALEVTQAPPSGSATLASIKGSKTALYNRVKAALDTQRVVLPPSAAVAGIYARVDRDQGVWKAPANVGVMSVLGPVSKINDQEQMLLNIDATTGKSINAIRAFVGKGTLVWGARTLLGNDNGWRYVNVRRLFITIEESAKAASAFAVFEANDQATWLKVKAMIESYLYGLWEQGALAGAKPEDAYYVHVGLGTTMTPDDVLNGRMIVAVGIAAVRPAEFVVIRFSHKLQTT